MYSRLISASSKSANVEFSPFGLSGTVVTITLLSFTMNPSSSSAFIAFSVSDTINLRIPYFVVSATDNARMFILAFDNVSIAFLILPSLFSINTEI